MFIWDLFFTHAETLKKKKSSNRYRKIVKRSWRKYVLTRWTKTSDRTDRIIDPFPGMDEKTSCSVLSRKGTGVEYGTGCLTKEARFLILNSNLQLWLHIYWTLAARSGKINGKLLSFVLKFILQSLMFVCHLWNVQMQTSPKFWSYWIAKDTYGFLMAQPFFYYWNYSREDTD